MQESNEFGQLARQRSFSAATVSPRCSSHCWDLLRGGGGGGRRGKSLADFEFESLIRDCSTFFCCSSPRQQPAHRQSHGAAGSIDAGDGYSDNEDDEFDAKAPISRWKLFCRKLRAEARRNYMERHRAISSSTTRFRYDALSYAMNFDDGASTMRDAGGVEQIRLHSMRFSGGIVVDGPPITISAPA